MTHRRRSVLPLLLLLALWAASARAQLLAVRDTKFEPKRGVYTEPQSVRVYTETVGATIRYTLDGSTPSETHGDIYTGPIAITSTSVLRAMAYQDGLVPTNVDTQTYVLVDDVLSQSETAEPAGRFWSTAMDATLRASYADAQLRAALHSLPALSLTFTDAEFWSASGIHWGSTLQSEAEVRCAAELLYPSTSPLRGWQSPAGLQLSGRSPRKDGGSRTHKQSFSLSFRSEYGAGRLREPVFADAETAGEYVPEAQAYNKLYVRSAFEEGWTYAAPGATRPSQATMLRDAWATVVTAAMNDGHAPRGRFVHLFLNGLYWGIYNLHERADDAFEAEYAAPVRSPASFYATKDNNYNGVNSTRFDALHTSVTLSSNIAYVRANLDTARLIDWLLLQWYTGAGDDVKWLATTQLDPPGPTRFYPRDMETMLDTRLGASTSARVRWLPGHKSTVLAQQLLSNNPEFRVELMDRAHAHLLAPNGALGDQRAVALWDALVDTLDTAVVLESLRWGDEHYSPAFTREADWIPATTSVRNRLLGNADRLLAALRADDLYPTSDAPVFSGVPTDGRVDGSTAMLHVHHPSHNFYYSIGTGDARDPGSVLVPAGIAGTAVKLQLPARITARAFAPGVDSWTDWSAAHTVTLFPEQPLARDLKLTEVMYRPLNALEDLWGHGQEFLEYKNIGTSTLHLSGVRFAAGVRMTFDWGTSVPPGGFLVLVRDPTGFAARYPGVQTHGTFAGNLRSDLTLTLVEHDGRIVNSVAYSNNEPWPQLAATAGHSLVPITANPSGSQDSAAAWKDSAAPGGSPGADDVYLPTFSLGTLLLVALGVIAGAVLLTAGVTGWYTKRKDREAADAAAEWEAYQAEQQRMKKEKKAKKKAKREAKMRASLELEAATSVVPAPSAGIDDDGTLTTFSMQSLPSKASLPADTATLHSTAGASSRRASDVTTVLSTASRYLVDSLSTTGPPSPLADSPATLFGIPQPLEHYQVHTRPYSMATESAAPIVPEDNDGFGVAYPSSSADNTTPGNPGAEARRVAKRRARRARRATPTSSTTPSPNLPSGGRAEPRMGRRRRSPKQRSDDVAEVQQSAPVEIVSASYGVDVEDSEGSATAISAGVTLAATDNSAASLGSSELRDSLAASEPSAVLARPAVLVEHEEPAAGPESGDLLPGAEVPITPRTASMMVSGKELRVHSAGSMTSATNHELPRPHSLTSADGKPLPMHKAHVLGAEARAMQSYIAYEVTLEVNAAYTWTIVRRYTEFHELQQLLRRDGFVFQNFPGKEPFSLLRSASGNDLQSDVVVTRVDLLPRWLEAVLAHPAASQHPVVLRFVDPKRAVGNHEPLEPPPSYDAAVVEREATTT